MDEKEKPKKSEKDAQPKEPEVMGSPSDIFREIDDYQKQIEQEWESTRKNYKDKIDQIMEDFIKTNGIEAVKEEAPSPPPKEKTSKPDIPFKSDPHIDSLVTKIQKTLDEAQKKNQLLAYDRFGTPPIINVSWVPLRGRHKRVLIRSLVLGGVVLVGLGIRHFLYHVQTITRLPYIHTSGVLVEKNKVIIADWFRKALYVHKLQKGLPIVSVESLPNQFATGFAFTAKSFLSVDGFDKKINTHTLTEDHRLLDQIDTPGPAPAGLFWDGTDAWVADNMKKTLYQLRGNELTDVKKEYAFKDVNVTSLQIRDKRAWILDGQTRELHVFRLQEPLKSLGVIDLDSFLNNGTPTGVFVDGKCVWVATENPPQLVRIHRQKLKKFE